MNSKIRSTLSALSVLGIFLGASLLLAQPLPATDAGSPHTINASADGMDAQVRVQLGQINASGHNAVTFNAKQGLGAVKLSLTLPYVAIGRLLAAQSES